jgi:hypothetical protein
MYALRKTRRAKRFTALAAGGLLVVLSGSALAADSARPASSAEYPLVVVAFDTTPKRPKAGKQFIALAAIMNEQTGSPVSGAIRCPAKIRGKGVRVQFKDFEMGVAGCSWVVPARTGGKRFVGSIEVVVTDDYDGSTYSASIPFTKVIRR